MPPSGRTIRGRAGTDRSRLATDRAPPSRALARLIRRLARIINMAAIAIQEMATSRIAHAASASKITSYAQPTP